jgi:hypothetical protein
MAKVKDIFPDTPAIPLDTELVNKATLADIWARYDEETDSMTIYVTGKPVPGVNVYLKDDVYAIVDTRNQNKVVGLYFEAWEDHVPQFEIVNRSWREIRKGEEWVPALRMLALVLLTMNPTLDPQFV